TPLDHLEADILTWANTLDSVRRSGLKPIVFFPSSAAVYGNPEKLPVTEDANLAPISPYGFHKAACELLATEYSECFGLDIIIARFFSTFGEGQRRLLIWELYRQLAAPGDAVVLNGTGKESRDYLEVTDAMTAVLEVIQHRIKELRPSSTGNTVVVNIAS